MYVNTCCGNKNKIKLKKKKKIEFDTRGQTPGLDTDNIPVRAKIATVYPTQDKKKRL